jgi:hypothetical protein
MLGERWFPKLFRFRKEEFPELVRIYDIPDRVVVSGRSVFSSWTALAVFLRR